MSQSHLILGTPGGLDGEFVRESFVKVQANFDELYSFFPRPEYTLSSLSASNTFDLLKDGIAVSTLDLTALYQNLQEVTTLGNTSTHQIISTNKEGFLVEDSGNNNIHTQMGVELDGGNSRGIITFGHMNGAETYLSGPLAPAMTGATVILPNINVNRVLPVAINGQYADNEGNITIDFEDVVAAGWVPSNYTPIGGTTLDAQLLGIDSELGTLTSNLTTVTNNTVVAASPTSTGTVLSLNRTTGSFYNMATPSNSTTFTTSSTITGGWAKCRFNTVSQPSVTGGTREGGNAFVANTDMDLLVWHDGTSVKYAFIGLSTTSNATLQDVITAGNVYGDVDNTWTFENGRITHRDINENWGINIGGEEFIFTDGAGNSTGRSYIGPEQIGIGNLSFIGDISSQNITANRNYQLPDTSGELALTSDITINSTTVGEPKGSDQVINIISLTQAEYDAGKPVATTFYIITDA